MRVAREFANRPHKQHNSSGGIRTHGFCHCSKIYGFVGNWGWAIIILTFLVKLVFYPLSAASYKSMAKMKKLSPRMATLKERYADDKQKFQQEMMKMYKETGVNPLGGCLPMLLQYPIIIALWQFLPQAKQSPVSSTTRL